MRAVPQISALVLLVKLHSCARAGESSPRVGDDAAGSSTALHGIQLVVTPAEETSIVQAWDPNTGERERERVCVASWLLSIGLDRRKSRGTQAERLLRGGVRRAQRVGFDIEDAGRGRPVA